MNTQYSELLGSFIRKGNFPIEADFIFSTEEALKNFYSDKLNVTVLHKGLLKLVEQDEDGKQALFWVIEKDGKLEFEKLISANNIQELLEELDNLEDKLDTEIEERKEVDEQFVAAFNEFKSQVESAYQDLLSTDAKLREDLNATVGTEGDIIKHLKNLPYQSLTEIANKLKEAYSQFPHIYEDILQIRNGVGLDGSGRFSPDQGTNYLKSATSVMNALKTLDNLINEANDNLKLSETLDNQIILKSDGIYHSIDWDYKDGRLDFYVNGSLVKYFDLGLSGLVSDGRYEASTEQIIIELSLPGGKKQELKIPAGALIEEWEILNNPESAIELHRDRNFDGKDTLSADVKLSPNKYNILKKDGNGRLLVKGTADNIVFEGDLSVQKKIEQVENSISATINDKLTNVENKLNSEIERSTDKDNEFTQSLIQVNTTLGSINNSLERKIESVELVDNKDLSYTILVDSKSIGTIQIPEDQYISDVILEDNKLKFTTTSGISIKDIDLAELVGEYVSEIEALPIIKDFIDKVQDLPSDPNVGDKYVLPVDNEGTFSYWVYEYTEDGWTATLLKIGNIVSLIDRDIYQLTSTGLKQLLDKSNIIDKEINNNSDVLLSISESGLSAQIIVSEYD